MSNAIRNALGANGGFQVLNITANADSVRITGRVPVPLGPKWLQLVHALKTAEKCEQWSVDISQFYFLQPVGGIEKIFYSWRVIFRFSCPEDEERIVNVLTSFTPKVNAPPKATQDSAPPQPQGWVNARGKGVVPFGTLPPILAGKVAQ